MIFGLFKKKVPAPAPAAPPDPSLDQSPTPAPPSNMSIAIKGTLMLAAATVLQQIVASGVDATPLAVLPPVAKLAITLIAPTLLAYFMKPPHK